MLESKPERREGDRSMGGRTFMCGLSSCFFHTLVHNALNAGGMGAGPHIKSGRVPFFFHHHHHLHFG